MSLPKPLSELLACAAAALLLLLPTTPAFADPLPSEQGAIAQVVAPDGTAAFYSTFEEAVDAAAEGATVNLLADATVSGVTASGDNQVALRFAKPLTIDGQGHVLTVGGLGIYVVGGPDEAHTYRTTFRNITVTNPSPDGRVVSARNGYKELIFDDAIMAATGTGSTQVFTAGGNTPQATSIAFNGCTLSASASGFGIVTLNPVQLTLADTDVSGYSALYVRGQDSSAGSSGSVIDIIAGSALSSTGITGATNGLGTITIQGCENVRVNVESSSVTAQASTASDLVQAVVMFAGSTDAQRLQAKGNTVTFGLGSTVKALGESSALAVGDDAQNVIEAKDGTFELQGKVFASDDDPAGATLRVTGGRWNRDVGAYMPEGYVIAHESTGPYVVAQKEARENDPTQPATPDDTPDHADRSTQVATPDESAKAAVVTRPASDPSVRATVQQTGDGELPLVAGASVVIIVVSCLLALRRRASGHRC